MGAITCRAARTARIAVAVVALALAGTRAHAQPLSMCMGRTAEEQAIDEALASDARRGPEWSFWWGFSFAVAAMGTGLVATLATDDQISERTRVGLWVSSAKAAIGALGRGLTPLRIPWGERACVDPAIHPTGTQRAILARAARRERNAAILTVVGGLAVNTGGLLYLGLERDDWRTGWITFASGTLVGLASVWTMPRRSWSLRRRLGGLGVAPVVPIGGAGGGAISGLSLVGTW